MLVISQFMTSTNYQWYKKTQLADMLTQKKENLYVKVAAYSHNNKLMAFLYWITADSSDRCGM